MLLGARLLPAVAAAQESAPADSGHATVTREEVKTWTATIDGKEWEVHPFAPSYEGTTGLFHMPIAYTLPKGKFSFSLFRDNLDRDPKDEDISIHGLSLGYGATEKLEIFGNFGLQNRIDADALFQAGFVNDYPFVATPWETGVGDVKLGSSTSSSTTTTVTAWAWPYAGLRSCPRRTRRRAWARARPRSGATSSSPSRCR